MAGGQESARSTLHLAELFRLADRAGLLRDPERAAERMRCVMAVRGWRREPRLSFRGSPQARTRTVAPPLRIGGDGRAIPQPLVLMGSGSAFVGPGITKNARLLRRPRAPLPQHRHRAEARRPPRHRRGLRPARHPRRLALARPGRGGRARPGRAGRQGRRARPLRLLPRRHVPGRRRACAAKPGTTTAAQSTRRRRSAPPASSWWSAACRSSRARAPRPRRTFPPPMPRSRTASRRCSNMPAAPTCRSRSSRCIRCTPPTAPA